MQDSRTLACFSRWQGEAHRATVGPEHHNGRWDGVSPKPSSRTVEARIMPSIFPYNAFRYNMIYFKLLMVIESPPFVSAKAQGEEERRRDASGDSCLSVFSDKTISAFKLLKFRVVVAPP